MENMKSLKNKISKLKKEENNYKEKIKLNNELKYLIKEQNKRKFDKKHPILAKVSKGAINLAKNVGTDSTKKRKRSKQANDTINKLINGF